MRAGAKLIVSLEAAFARPLFVGNLDVFLAVEVIETFDHGIGEFAEPVRRSLAAERGIGGNLGQNQRQGLADAALALGEICRGQ